MPSTLSISRLSHWSWFMLRYGDEIIHIDPGYGASGDYSAIPEVAFKQPATIILITHGHADHVRPEVVRRLVGKDTVIIAGEDALDRELFKFQQVEGDSTYSVRQVTIKTVPAYNTPEGRSTRKFHIKGQGVGHVVEIGPWRIYHSGDTDVIPEMRRCTGVDIAMLPISGIYVMDPEEAVEAIKIIAPKIFIPMHEMDHPEDKRKRLPSLINKTKTIFVDCGARIDI